MSRFEPLLLAALMAGWSSSAAILVSAGANLRIASKDGYSALALAADRNALGVVRLMLGRGVDPNWGGSQTLGTPLMFAARNPDIRMLRDLIAAGGDVNPCDISGESPLTVAAHYHNLDALEALVRAGADPLVVSHNGSTALHWAALGCLAGGHNATLFARLIQLGVDPKKCDSAGRSALDIAMNYDRWECSKALRQAGCIDRYSAPDSWDDEVIPDRYDYFISYRHRRFKATAQSLAVALTAQGCSVFLDTLAVSLESATPEGTIKRQLYIGLRSAMCTLFFESEFEAEVDPTIASVRAFSWQLFELLYSKDMLLVYRMPDTAGIDQLVVDAQKRRGPGT
jgi:ankyrin repeat protein